MIECCEPATKIRTNLPWAPARSPTRPPIAYDPVGGRVGERAGADSTQVGNALAEQRRQNRVQPLPPGRGGAQAVSVQHQKFAVDQRLTAFNAERFF